ncbi:MAG: N-acetyl sugar amidotransferase [Bacteroidota bacterium]
MPVKYQICSNCIMDTSDPDIIFSDLGVCNYCTDYKKTKKQEQASETNTNFTQLIESIKKNQCLEKYDCLLGLSGGVDSSYAALILHQLGLRVLVVHLDNGWNSELSAINIEHVLKKTGFDLFSEVLDWNEFRLMQLSYLKSGVIDLEALTDHAINATLYKTALKYNIKYIFTGSNPSSESVLPLSWRYDQKLTDSKNIKGITKRFGKFKPKYFPLISLYQYFLYRFFYKINQIPLFNYIKFDKMEALNLLKSESNWQDYGGKHYESIITRIYQSYILIVRFGIDKRRAHYSSEIIHGELSREDALKLISKPPISDMQLAYDLDYFKKKLKIDDNQFNKILSTKLVSHLHYRNNKLDRTILFSLNKFLKCLRELL